MTNPGESLAIHEGGGKLVATAIHDGHHVREELESRFALSSEARFREEDPFTGAWTSVATTQVLVHRSRFEVDLNRPRDQAVYQRPEHAWGLKVWSEPLPPAVLERSRAEYDVFYQRMEHLLSKIAAREGGFVVFDLHSYNHRRGGPDAPPDDPERNPEINVGTGTMNRKRWGPVVDRLIDDLRAFDFLGRRLDVRENVKFYGGNMTRFIHERFPTEGCSLAIEAKKFFMNEWTGERYPREHEAIGQALRFAVPGVLEALEAVLGVH